MPLIRVWFLGSPSLNTCIVYLFCSCWFCVPGVILRLGTVIISAKIKVGKCAATRESSPLLGLNFTFLGISVKLLVFVFSLNWVSFSGL